MYFPVVAGLLFLTSFVAAAPAPAHQVARSGEKISIGAVLDGLKGASVKNNAVSAGTATSIEYETCPSVGTIYNVTVEPCQGGSGSLDSPCEFTAGENYTITITFSTPISSTYPRSNLVAHDPHPSPNNAPNYPYSGQAFDACRWYLNCPVQEEITQKYTYGFHTLNSPGFDKLTYNITDGLSGPAFICASFPVTFVPPS